MHPESINALHSLVLQALNLTEPLSNGSLVATIFAPSDEAFAAALTALDLTAEQLLRNTSLLETVGGRRCPEQ